MADENDFLRRMRTDFQAGDDFSSLQNLKAESDPGLLALETLGNLRREEQLRLQAKLQRMQGENPNEPKWEPKVHWPLLQKLNELLGEGEGSDYIAEKDKQRRR